MKTRSQYLRERTKQIRAEMFRGFAIMFVIACVLMICAAVLLLRMQSAMYEDRINSITMEYETELTSMETNHANELAYYKDLTTEYDGVITELTTRLNDSHSESVDLFELCRKYWYVFRDAPDNSGLALEDMVYLDNLCKDYDLNPHIMWCIYDNESGYTTVIDNFSGSSARGLGQVLASTGKSMYENVLQLGSYTHELAYDAQINMQITTAMIARNVDSGLYNAIALYSGDSTGGYYNRILSTAADHGVDISDTSYQ